MITEDYVSFETAKLLKEKGFDEQTRDFYHFENNIWIHRNTYEHNHFNLGVPRWENCYSCPTLQMAMKWLREVHHIFLSIQQHMDMSYVWYVYANGAPKGCDRESHNNSYEQACETAIKYCLENLI